MSKEKHYSYDPGYAVPPGRTLLETIEHIGMERRELATRMGLNEETIDQIINGDYSISEEIAISLERETGVPARMWNNMERLFQKRKKQQI